MTARPAAGAAPARGQTKESALETHLRLAMAAVGLPVAEQEYRFHPSRMWRLDFAWPSLMLAVEIEGGIYRGGGHTHVKDLKRDMEKHRALTLLGWRCLRFHGDEVRSGEAVNVIREAMRLFSGESAPARPPYTFVATCGVCGVEIGGDGDVCNRCAAT